MSATFFARNDPRFVLAFSIPCNSKGLKILAREPVGRWYGSWGHPFMDLDEQDCMLFFDNVLIPWDRLFFLYESPARMMTIAGPGGADINFAGWANLERCLFRYRLLTAVATMVAEPLERGFGTTLGNALRRVLLSSLQGAAEQIAKTLDGCPPQGVPFTAAIGGSAETSGLMSWGFDPPADPAAPEWLRRESWRLKLSNRLVAALALAKQNPAADVSPVDFALERIRLEGVNTETWEVRQ